MTNTNAAMPVEKGSLHNLFTVLMTEGGSLIHRPYCMTYYMYYHLLTMHYFFPTFTCTHSEMVWVGV